MVLPSRIAFETRLWRAALLGLLLMLGNHADAQMTWMFGDPADPAAPPVTRVNFDELGLIDASGAQPMVGSSVAPLPAPAAAGLDPGAASSTAGPSTAGPSTAGPSTAGPSAAGPSASVVVEPEPLPLADQTARWYAYPWMWMQSGWTNSAEFGLNASEGNTTSLSLQTGAELKRETDRYTFELDFDYYRTKTAGILTQDNGRLNLDFDRLLGESRWSAFGKLGLEWNEFRPFDLRVNLNGGAGYHWFRNDQTKIVTRFGAGASREIGSPDDQWTPEALFGVEAEQQLTSQQKLKATIDYFPNWGNFSDYRLVTDLSWEILLDDSDNLSLKLATTNRYDSTPQGALPRDLFYSMLLLYKF